AMPPRPLPSVKAALMRLLAALGGRTLLFEKIDARANGPVGSREMAIPGNAPNALQDVSLSAALTAFSADSELPSGEIQKRIRSEEQEDGVTLDEQSKLLSRLGKTAGLSGSAVYYPFGGFDPYAPFAMVPGASDVFSLGIEEFGTPEQIAAFFQRGGALDEKSLRFRYYDSTINTDMLREDYQVSGLGALAAARIIAFLRGRVTGLYYFSIAPDGSLVFSERGDNGASAVIEFEDPSGNRKRFWYFRDDVYDPSSGFLSLSRQNGFSFQTLLIKAAPSAIWNSPEKTEREREAARAKTLEPALRVNAAGTPVTVFTDKGNNSSRLMSAEEAQRPIWAPG
ncbi:MAG: hypothetical protein ACYC5N_11225, partial [Endomicrobiales bacterium]